MRLILEFSNKNYCYSTFKIYFWSNENISFFSVPSFFILHFYIFLMDLIAWNNCFFFAFYSLSLKENSDWNRNKIAICWVKSKSNDDWLRYRQCSNDAY